MIVAAGRGKVNGMFERDAEKSPYDKPMRALALTYVKKMEPRAPFTRRRARPGLKEQSVRRDQRVRQALRDHKG
jgi:hypothetical protein